MGGQGFIRSEIRDEAITFQKYLSTKALDTDRHGRLIREIEIPGVNPDDNNNMDTASVFDDDIDLPEVDAEETKAPKKLRFMISKSQATQTLFR